MMHTLCKYADETIRVVFERPKEYGFDTIIFELSSYKIIERDGKYTDFKIMSKLWK